MLAYFRVIYLMKTHDFNYHFCQFGQPEVLSFRSMGPIALDIANSADKMSINALESPLP